MQVLSSVASGAAATTISQVINSYALMSQVIWIRPEMQEMIWPPRNSFKGLHHSLLPWVMDSRNKISAQTRMCL